MNVASPQLESRRGARRVATPSRAQRWARLGTGIASAGVMGAAWLGCGSSDEGGGDVPGFNGIAPPTGTGGTSGAVPSGGSGGGSTVGVPEGMNPNTPIDQPTQTPVGTACTANSASCSGNVLNRCDAAGVALAPQDCAATGGSCGVTGGVAACVAPTCTPNALSCESANEIGTCAADGSALALSRCADGSVCEGAGTCSPVACNTQSLLSFNGGEATVYWFGQGTVNFGDIACGFGIQPGNLNNGDGDAVNGIANPTMFAAMNTQNYADAAACGACVQMNYQGRSVQVTVVDECPIGSNPTCTAGHIDLSRGAWNQLTGNAAGTQIFGVNWNYVPCDSDDNVTVQLKEPANAYWNEFLVRGHKYPIAKAEVERDDGTWVEAERTRYNYFHPPADDMGTYRVRLTDINGGVLEEQLELAAGAQGGNGQFDCQ